MKRVPVVFLSVGVLFCVTFCLLSIVAGTPVQAAEPIKIGVVASVTGPAGFVGKPEKMAILACAEMINQEGGLFGRKIEIYLEDDQTNPTTATVATTKLIRDKKVAAIIGGSTTEACQGMIPICEREQVAQLPMAPLTVPQKKWVFLVPLDDYYLAEKMVAFTVKTLGAKRLAILNESGPYGKKGANGIKAHAPKYGASIIISEQCEATDTDMTPQMTRIKSTKPDALMIFTPAFTAAVIAKNYQQLAMQSLPVITGGGVPSKEFPKLAGKVVEDGRWIPFDPIDLYAEQLPPDDPFRKELYDPLFRAIKQLYGKETEWDGFFRNGYDNIAIVIEALKIAKTDDRAALRDALEKVKYRGFLGTFAYSPTDHQGTTGETFVPIMIKDGKYWPYKK